MAPINPPKQFSSRVADQVGYPDIYPPSASIPPAPTGLSHVGVQERDPRTIEERLAQVEEQQRVLHQHTNDRLTDLHQAIGNVAATVNAIFSVLRR